MDKFDIVVFGATGYAGKYVVENLANPKSNIENLTWAVAGRSAGKLAEVLQTVGSWVGKDLSQVERILANIDDDDSLVAMCKRARVLINCVGPYTLYGEPVVRAAVSTGCHHIDLAGEEFYLKSVALKYHEKAKETKTYVVLACGFDSAVCDIGIEYLTQNSPYQLNSVSCYIVPHMPSIELNFGTYWATIHAVHDWWKIGSLNRALFPKALPEPKYKLRAWPLSYKSDAPVNGRWTLHFPAGDREIARWTQYYKYAVENKRPIQIENYLCAERTIQVFGAALTITNIALFSLTNWGRNLLEKNPEFFSFGAFRSNGPSREVVLNRSFEMVFEGQAFEQSSEPNYGAANEPKGPPTKTVKARIVGPDPGYITCATCLVQAAVCLLKDADKLPPGGGAFTPAAVLSRSSYIERLQKHGLDFEMLQS